MQHKTIIKIILIIIVICGLLTYLLTQLVDAIFTNDTAAINYSDRAEIEEILGDKKLEFYFRHGLTLTSGSVVEDNNPEFIEVDDKFITEIMDANPELYTQENYYKFSYSNQEIKIQKIEDQSIMKSIYLAGADLIADPGEMRSFDSWMTIDRNAQHTIFAGEIKNNKNEVIKWDTNINNLGELKLIRPNGEQRILATGENVTLAPMFSKPIVRRVQWLNDELVIMELTNQVGILEAMAKCDSETPFYRKIAIISPCDNDYFIPDPDSSIAQKYNTLMSGFYTEAEPSIIVMNVNTGKWAEVMIGKDVLIIKSKH